MGLEFPGSPVVKNPLANARDMGSIPGLGGSHTLQSNEAHVPQQLSLCPRVWELQLLTPACPRTCAQQQEEPLERRSVNSKEDPGQSIKRKQTNKKNNSMSFPFRETWVQILVSLVAQTVKHLPAMWETQVLFLGQEFPLEKEMAIHSSILAWKIPWTE